MRRIDGERREQRKDALHEDELQPGALNESFSDVMGTSAEFYFQQPGSGNLRADYLIGGQGNDTLHGSGAGTTLQGGEGDDTYLVTDLSQSVFEFADEGAVRRVVSAGCCCAAASVRERVIT